VFVDGRFARELSHIAAHDGGVVVTNLAAALETSPELIEPHLARLASSERDAFAALNEAFFTDGAFLHVPAGRALADPVRLVFLTTGQEPGATVSTRNLIVAGAASRFTVIEQCASLTQAVHVTNAITELAADDRAAIEYLRFQDEGAGALSVGGCHTRLGRAVNLNLHSFALGGRLARYTIRAGLHGEGIEAVLNGLYIVDGDRLADHHMIVDHAQPHCASHEYFNGILGGRSRGVFHGRILVRPGAQKTDAKQTNKNILISDDATAIAKPQLEIYADDVKCTHGATVGQLHPEQVFYLRARGIPVEIARRMLIHAFAGEIIDRVGCTPAREELDGLIWDRLERDERIQLGAHH
jgi:Fe-S cluster assembly protein SufD